MTLKETYYAELLQIADEKARDYLDDSSQTNAADTHPGIDPADPDCVYWQTAIYTLRDQRDLRCL